ncbi:hypothetical protein IJG91_02040 [Candidatus Saccharibacteria bacterium]|nr:hypothetical protein [Candidatus Saccharibacteria bacterium]
MMFFSDLESIRNIAEKSGFSIFCVPNPEEISIKNAFRIMPGKTGKITKEQADEMIDICKLKETKSRFIVVENAEAMNENAENAILKLLEEPKENYHIVFLTKEPSALLETVLSRANVYIFRQENALGVPISTSENIKNYAKKLITAKDTQILNITKDIMSEKEYKKTGNSRLFTLKIIETAIEILYKSYFKTKNPELLKKLPNFLKLYDNLKQNGNIKLHLVADLC